MKKSFVGFIVESIGILALFGDFFAVIVQFLRSIPYIGPLLSHPYIAPVSIKLLLCLPIELLTHIRLLIE